MTPEQRAERAVRFRALVEDGEIGEAFDAIEHGLTQSMVDCFDDQERNNLWRSIRILKSMRQWMGSAMADKRLAQHDVTSIRRIK